MNISNEEFHKDATGLLMEVTGIKSDQSKYFPNSKHSVSLVSGNFTYSQYEEFVIPIKLTEEWLLNFGFVFTDCGYELIIKKKRARLSVILKPDGIGMVGIAGPFGLYDTIHYKFVYQLQNLYFALTGEELKIKDNLEDRIVKVHDEHILDYEFNPE